MSAEEPSELQGQSGTGDSPDVFALTADLVDFASESFEEQALVDWLERELALCPHLDVIRIGDNLIARTTGSASSRVILAGHTDTVAANENFPGRIEGDVLFGVGSADMKGGLAIMLAAARHFTNPMLEVTYVFYAREEVASVHNGLKEVLQKRPDLLVGDLALLGEPTDAAIEAGCQGSIRAAVTLLGARAHTARAWMGRNAIHRAGPLLNALAGAEIRQPEIEGCTFHEAIQVVDIVGGVSGNVVPDRCTVTVAYRFAPDRSLDEAEQHLRELCEPYLEAGDQIDIVDRANAALPAVTHPILQSLVARHGLEVRSKLGWTDVARFAAIGVPAANFGPGDPTVAHTAGEFVTRDSVERAWKCIEDLLTAGI